MRDIIAMRAGNKISRSPYDLMDALNNKTPVQWVDRAYMQKLAEEDPKEKWKNLANSETLFFLDSNGNMV